MLVAWAISSLACFCSSAIRALVDSGRFLNCSGSVITKVRSSSALSLACCSSTGRLPDSSLIFLLAFSWVSASAPLSASASASVRPATAYSGVYSDSSADFLAWSGFCLRGMCIAPCSMMGES